MKSGYLMVLLRTCGTLYTAVVVATTPIFKSTTPMTKLQPQHWKIKNQPKTHENEQNMYHTEADN